MEGLSPMMQQYFDIKSEYEDCVLFFRLGDFYEMFFDDAVKISKELELTLTGKDCGLAQRAPMCGIPYHASEVYIKKLIDKGYKVAICEQIEDPAKTKTLVKRDVIRIITPGTVIENNLLNEESNNFIASLIIENSMFSVSFADISTGEVHSTVHRATDMSSEVINELSKFVPSEILINSEVLKYKDITDFIKTKLSCVCNVYSESDLYFQYCVKAISEAFEEKFFKKLAASDMDIAMVSIGGLIKYVQKTQKDTNFKIVNFEVYNEDQYMNIDLTARRNLEITQSMRSGEKRGTLLWVLDKTKTAMGKRYIKKAIEQPLLNKNDILDRQSAVKELVEKNQKRDELSQQIEHVYDLERLMTRVNFNSASPRDVKSLGFTLSFFPAIKELIGDCDAPYLKKINNEIHILNDVCSLIENAIVDEPPATLKDGGVIKQGFNAELDELRNICTNAKGYIAQIEEEEKQKTGISKLKIGYNRVFGYYIEITKSNLAQVPDTYIRKQTLVNSERYITQELKDIELKILSANDKIQALEADIFKEVVSYISDKSSKIQETANAIARLDFIYSLAEVAVENNYVCPEIADDNRLIIKDGRHPVVEKALKNALFVPNDTTLDTENDKIIIITGPNMAGKSTYMRQVAIITIMAQIGSFVPASYAQIGICDKVFARVGASDDLTSGQSTFMVEMSEVAHILSNATKRSLIILDEIGRGTSTFDGMSIAKAVVSYISENERLGCKTLFATHYHELTELESESEGIKNYNVAVKKRGDDITFLRKIVPGGTDESYGIEVAKIAGLPEALIKDAKECLEVLESQGTGVGKIPSADIAKKREKPVLQEVDEHDPVIEKLKEISVDTLTPIEALNMLYKLKNML